MSELYLIAHKVRGEPAFDVATQIECPICVDGQVVAASKDELIGCHECDSLGYWWIIPTSGHRAYPYDHQPLLECIELADWTEMPEGLPDHYTTSAAPTRTLADMLGFLNAPLTRRAPPLKRRF